MSKKNQDEKDELVNQLNTVLEDSTLDGKNTKNQEVEVELEVDVDDSPPKTSETDGNHLRSISFAQEVQPEAQEPNQSDNDSPDSQPNADSVANITSIPTGKMVDLINQLPPGVLRKIQGKYAEKYDLLINMSDLLKKGKLARGEIASRQNLNMTKEELQELLETIPEEYRSILLEKGGKTEKKSLELSSVFSNKTYSIPAGDLLDIWNRVPKETLETIQKQHETKWDHECLLDLYEKASTAAPEENIDVTGKEMKDLLKMIPDEDQKRLMDENSFIGSILKEIKAQAAATPPKTGGSDPATKEAFAMKEKIEEQSKKINEMKGQLQFYLAKGKKGAEKEIQALKSEIKKANEALKNMIQDFIKFQKESNVSIAEPIMLATTLNEDKIPKCLAIGPSKTDQKRFMTPSVLKTIDRRPSVTTQRKMASDNSSLVRERCQLQQELQNRDRIVENLQENLCVMQNELTKMTCENAQLAKKIDNMGKPQNAPVDIACRLQAYKENADSLEQNITKMSHALNHLQVELTGLQSDREGLQKVRPATAITCPTRRCRNDTQKKSLEEENQDLKKQYALLLQEYSRKEREVNDMAEKYRKGMECDEFKSPEKMELDIVRKQYNDLLDEQEEFKVIIKEQSDQVEEYREKFMKAQQTVEEQRREIENMDINNAKIEEQINMEIQRIKHEFQKKLREFAPLPQMLENEQLRLHESQKKNKELEDKLCEYVQKVSEAEARVQALQSRGGESNVVMLEELRNKIGALTGQIQDLHQDRNRLEDMLHDEKCRNEMLRSETAKIIQRANDRHETAKKLQQNQISKLENDLAKAKADAACDAATHEATVRKIENQMKILTRNFDDAQVQISTLQNHITFLTQADKLDKKNPKKTP